MQGQRNRGVKATDYAVGLSVFAMMAVRGEAVAQSDPVSSVL